jgi:hypothetical protein
LLEDGAGVLANFLIGNTGNVGGKSADQTLPDVRMKMRLKLRPVRVLTTDDETLKDTFLEIDAQPFCNRLEMLERFLATRRSAWPAS